ncbi:MAG: hypothetical protein WC479_03110 [Candidatus Izemoplasmatales bacterium]
MKKYKYSRKQWLKIADNPALLLKKSLGLGDVTKDLREALLSTVEPKKGCKHDWVTSYTTPIGTGYECSKCGVEKGMEEKCNCHYQCGCDKGECNCYSLKPTPKKEQVVDLGYGVTCTGCQSRYCHCEVGKKSKKPIHSLPEKIDRSNFAREPNTNTNTWELMLKINSIIDWLQAEKEK